MKIDFVLTWVDGSDEEWNKDKNYYAQKRNDLLEEQVGDLRFRDWGLLKYWFRGVEKFAPWVNKIHFVTYGHLPEWLNTEHPKLKIVQHSDFMKSECLPTFNSCAIEINLHKIKGLSEHFVYFNDDFFIINEIYPENFFKNNLPCDEAIFTNYTSPTFDKHNYIHLLISEAGLINQNFNFKESVNVNINKYLNPIYDDQLYLNEFFTKRNLFPGLYQHHLPQSFRKSIFYEVWEKEPEILKEVTQHKFRTLKEVSQYIMRAWQIMKGEFEPSFFRKIGMSFGQTEKEIDEIVDFIIKQKRQIIVINDTQNIDNVEEISKKIKVAFENFLFEKSKFEK